MTKDVWSYNGQDYSPAEPRNLKGRNGRCSVQPGENGRLDLEIDGIKFDVPHGIAQELNAALTTALRPYAGFSIFERIMEELDAVIDRLMSGDGTAEDDRDPGRAEAFCRALALIRNPYDPDYEGERERQMERYEHRQDAEDK